MALAGWLNTAWMLKCAGEAWAFRRATRRVARTQADLLRQLLHANRHTEFGTAHCFDRIATPEEYQSRVPLATYEDVAPAVRRIADGASNVLTSAPVLLLEPTSGSSGGEKLIPYTAPLRRQFQRAVAAWVADLFWHRPALRRGRAYWSISPALGPPRRSPGGLPIGFEEDAAYLGTLERLALERLLVVPGRVARLRDLASFRYCTLLCLLRAPDLALISVWSPTFLTALLAPLEAWSERLCHDLRHGTINPPGPLPSELHAALTRALHPDVLRADRLAAIVRQQSTPAERLRVLWPQLTLISCWGDAAAAQYLPALRELFPTVEIQPKGLLATEGCVTFPLSGRPAPVLAVRSHFIEFQEIAAAGPCRLAHRVDRGGRYRVVLTTGGGLYRYQLGDEVEVVGFEQGCPLLRFLGRSGRVSDLAGEKLSDPHVQTVLERAFQALELAPSFALLVPVAAALPRYRLYLQETDLEGDSLRVAALRAELQRGLEENPHYGYAVRLGQLAPAEVQLLAGNEPAWLLYERVCLSRGQKAGNVKPAALDAWTGWPEVFAAAALPSSGQTPTTWPPAPGPSR